MVEELGVVRKRGKGVQSVHHVTLRITGIFPSFVENLSSSISPLSIDTPLLHIFGFIMKHKQTIVMHMLNQFWEVSSVYVRIREWVFW